MTTLLLQRPGRAAVVPSARRAYRVAAVAAILVGAFWLRLHILSAGAGLAASDGYDDGVYYAAADALVHGRLPYRDFLLLHPPGIVLALSPFAALGSVIGDHFGVGLARLAFIGIGTVNVALVMALARPHSRRAAAVAGIVAAVWFPLAYAERSTLLEPLGSVLVLTALLLARRPGRLSAVLGGVLCGFAVMVKIWYAAPLLVLLRFLPGRRAPFLVGAGAGAMSLALPFFAADPLAMLRQVVVDQLGRPRPAGTGLTRRLTTILSDPLTPVRTAPQLQTAELLAAVIGAALVVACIAAWRRRWARVFVAQLVAAVTVLLLGPSFFLHYAAFSAPWAAICFGIGGAALTDRIRIDWVRRNVLTVLCAAVVAVNLPAGVHSSPTPQPVRQLRPLLAGERGCVVSDDPGLLANADVLSRDLARGCPLWPDVTGWTYDRDGSAGPRAGNTRWQSHVLGYLLRGDAVVLARSSTGLSPESESVIDRLPVVARVGSLTVHRTR